MNKSHKTLIRRSFGNAACDYAANADFQVSLGHRLLSFSGLLNPSVTRFRHILDAGCGSGGVTLQKFFPQSTISGLDLAEAMLAGTVDNKPPKDSPTRKLICGDLESQPFADNAFDLIFCNAALQWCDKPENAIGEFSRVMAPGSVLLIATYGPQTLNELSSSWNGLDNYSHTLTFPDCRQLVRHLEGNGFDGIRSHCQLEVVSYASVKALMMSLKKIGARNCRTDRPDGLTSPGKMQTMTQYYAANHQMPGHQIPATYETILLLARRPESGF